ncbi:hypothetical protein FACS189472_17630 [Alphaproteobacteria bacterium]|nr:hypothetical protein FACS189472_17630 [Alphaproteobacteria bacterium]
MKSILNVIADIPEIPFDILNNVRNRFLEIGRDRFFDEFKKMDAESLVNKCDTQRLLRAYEIAIFTGKPLSYWWSLQEWLHHGRSLQDGRLSNNACAAITEANCEKDPLCSSLYDSVAIVLNPEREELKQVCHDRICSMIQNGAIEEVEDFAKRYENYSSPLVNAVGYREISALLQNEISLQDCIEKMHLRTRQYAKRQSTWFRNQMKGAFVFNNFGYVSKSLELLKKTL